MTSPYTSAPTSTFELSGNAVVDPLLNDSYQKWGGALGTRADLTFSFPWIDGNTALWQTDYSTGNEPAATYHYGFNATQMEAARKAIQAWVDVADIGFTEISETSSDVGDFRFAFSSALPEANWGWCVYPSNYWASAGDTWVNSTYGSETDWSAGTYNYEALIHEIGHGLGLKHPFDGSPTLPTGLDTRQYSLMSYTDAPYSQFVEYSTDAGGAYSRLVSPVNPDTPMLYDIAAIQYLYGANLSYKTGDDVYTFDPADPFYRTIWDAGGNDAVSVANFSQGCILDLQPGHYSKVTILSSPPQGVEWSEPLPATLYDGTDNLAIAYGCDIENAVGGSGDDYLIGNTLGNSLSGGAGGDTLAGSSGADTLIGGGGDDTAVFSGAATDYVVAYDAAAALYTVMDTVSGRDGTDSLAAVEWLKFSDGTLAPAGLAQNDTSSVNIETTVSADDYPWATDSGGVVSVGGSASSGVIDSSGDQDLFQVSLTAGTTYVFDLIRTSGGLSDPYLSLYDPLVTQVAGDDDGGGSLNARITYTAVATGTHYLGAYDADTGTGAYTITATVAQTGPASSTSGPDTLQGTAAADDMNGDYGNDTLWGGDGNDTLQGGYDHDQLFGESGRDDLSGNDGNDSLDGGLGLDTLSGGAGNDVYYPGYDAVDVIQDLGLAGDMDAVIVPYQLPKYTLPGGIENGEIAAASQAGNLTGNAANNALTGNDGNNSLSGLGGRDAILGGGGLDTLLGGGGTDTLNGGKGADVFDFNVPGEIGLNKARDIIADFKAADGDKIDVAGVDANASTAGNQAFGFIGASAFSAAGQLRFDAVAHVLHGNTDLDSTPEFSIQLNGVASLSAAAMVL
ncbi:MAG: hypothetical protein EPN21_11090 [Methylococcaceae bacterium]|nr:MAG: hypothetical protein EPN21_11090 [Methylococcaceae bacterium]